MRFKSLIGVILLGLQAPVFAQGALGNPAKGDDGPGKVIASGTVPDESARASILGKLRDVFGAANVVDRLEVGGVVPPANWTEHMSRIIHPNLKQVRGGVLQIEGTRIALRGNVANEAVSQQVVSTMATSLNPTYSIDNGLIASGNEAQKLLDKTLANRVVEFESGSATLTPVGRTLLDEMAAAIKQIGSPRMQLIGHTDSSGARQANIALSLARANAVKSYLVQEKGLSVETLLTVGSGPDQPIASNNTSEGRAKNRRIEFRLLNP